MSFYPKDLKEEALKQRVANDFFAKFSYEPLERVDFALKNKGEALDIIYLLWAEAKKGNEASVDESLVQLILTIGTQKLHKSYNTPEFLGAFYTPKIWVQKAQDYLQSALGKGWQDEYYIWDCAAGTGNLLKGLTNSAQIYASTLDLSDVLIMKELCKIDKNDKTKTPEQRLNLLDKNIFAFDFLNDDFSTLPQTLQEILKDEKKREKLIIFINPPYAEAASAKQVTGTGANKAQVALNNLKIEPYKNLYGKASNELFAQFFMRIYEEIKGCKLAQFSKLKIVQASNFIKFRERFKAKFLKGFVCPANTFDNVKGQFPIGFLIWDTKIKSNLKEIQVDIFEQDGEFLGHKTISAQNQNDRVINDWYSNFYDKNGNEIGVMNTRGNDFQNQNYIRITSINNFNHTNIITISNLIPSCIYFSVRHAIEASWLNDRDSFFTQMINGKRTANFKMIV